MPTITTSFDVTDAEHAVLVAGKCEAPHPDWLRSTLLNAAITNVIHEQGCPSPMSCKKVPRCLDGCERPPAVIAALRTTTP